MQKHINVKLYNNNSPYYTQLYLYNLIFAIEQCIIRNLLLKLDLL